MLVTTPTVKFLCLSRRRFTSGLSTVSSMATKAVRNTAATAESERMKDDANQSSLLPSSNTVWKAASPIAIVTTPAQSPSLRRSRRIGAGSSVRASAKTMAALGTCQCNSQMALIAQSRDDTGPDRGQLLDPEGAPGSTDLKHVPVSLTASPWGSLAAGHVQLFRPLGDVGQHRPQPFVLDNGGLIDLLQPIKGPIGQVNAVVADRQTPIGVVENGNPPARQRPADRVRLKKEQDLVVLEGQVERHRALLLPGEHIIQRDAFGQRAMSVAIRRRLLRKPGIVAVQEPWQECVGGLNRA